MSKRNQCTCYKVDKTGGKVTAKQFAQFTKASKGKERKSVGDYQIDNELSNEWVQVYHNPSNNHTVVYHRGTTDMADAWTDAKLFFGQTNNERFKTSERIQKAAERKYGHDNLSTLGSSLGGYLAQTYGGDSAEIITSGRPVTPGDILKKRQRKPNQYDVRVDADPVAVGQYLQQDTGREVIIPAKNKLNVMENHPGEQVMAQLPDDYEIGNPNVGYSIERRGGRIATVSELKAFIKTNRKKARIKVNVTGMKRPELIKVATEIAQQLALCSLG